MSQHKKRESRLRKTDNNHDGYNNLSDKTGDSSYSDYDSYDTLTDYSVHESYSSYSIHKSDFVPDDDYDDFNAEDWLISDLSDSGRYSYDSHSHHSLSLYNANDWDSHSSHYYKHRSYHSHSDSDPYHHNITSHYSDSDSYPHSISVKKDYDSNYGLKGYFDDGYEEESYHTHTSYTITNDRYSFLDSHNSYQKLKKQPKDAEIEYDYKELNGALDEFDSFLSDY